MKVEDRIEIKYIFSNSELNSFIKAYNLKNYLFPERTITSYYFDTINFKLYKNAIFQDSQNFKLRIRYYNNDLTKLFQETKISNQNGKSKRIEKLEPNIQIPFRIKFKNNILYKVSKVEYIRKYFYYKNSRITVDTNINFFTVQNRTFVNKSFSEKFNIVEFKLMKPNNYELMNDLPKLPESYSKFKRSIETLYNNTNYF